MAKNQKQDLITVPAEFHFGPSHKVEVEPGVKTIWCDEAGFTGNNLLDHTQPYFAYSAVALEAAEAQGVIDWLASERAMQGKERKASSLVQTPKGRGLLLETLRRLEGCYAVSLSEKKFALAGKFYEYIFEPILQENSKFFYDINFQKYIANVDEMRKHASSNWIFSDMDYIDLDKKGPVLNACLLMELARRAREGLDPLQDIVKHYAIFDWQYDKNPPPRHGNRVTSNRRRKSR